MNQRNKGGKFHKRTNSNSGNANNISNNNYQNNSDNMISNNQAVNNTRNNENFLNANQGMQNYSKLFLIYFYNKRT